MGLTRIKAEQISDIDYKQAVRAIQTTNVTLAGGAPSQVDGVNLMKNDRVLVAGQNTGSENGLYYVATLGTGSNGTWARTSDANQTGEIEAGMIVMVTEGTTYADTQWKLTTNDPIVIGTTPLTFVINILSSVGGSNTQIQYNSAGTLAGSPNLTWDGSQLYVGATANIGGNVLPAANVTYSLGSTSARWNDLWIANSSIYIGDVVLATTGSALTINGANVLTGNAGAAFSTTGNVTGGNLLTSGQVSATGNITGGNITGTLLTGTLATAAQPNVTSLGTLTSLNSGAISSSGNVTGANILTGGLISATGNITSNSNVTVGAATFTTSNIAVQGWSYSGVSLSITATEGTPTGIFFGNSSASFYVSGSGNDRVYQYNMSTPNMANTGVLLGNVSVATQDTGPADVYIDSTGANLYVMGGATDTVYQYTLSTPWNITTATYASKSFSVTAQEATPQGLWFRPDMTTMYIIGNTNDTVYQYTLSEAGNVASATYANKSFSVSSQDGTPTQVQLSSDGTTMWVLGQATNAVYAYTLGTAWDVSTASYTPGTSYGFRAQGDTGAGGLYVDTGNSRAWIVGSGQDTVFQYNTNNSAIIQGNNVGTIGSLMVGGNAAVSQVLQVGGAAGFESTVTVDGTLSALSTLSLVGTTTGAMLLGTSITTANANMFTSQTTGQMFVGGTTGTGQMTIGQSVGNQTLNLHTGTVGSGNTKTVNIGTGGASGSNTNVTIGSATAGATTTTLIYGNANIANITSTGTISATGNITGGNLTVSTGTVTAGNIVNSNSNGVGNIGSSTGYFNTVFAKATSAQYADVAEKYVADRFYPPGTVMEIGGAAEVQATTSYASTRIAGVISTNPALIMNSTQSDANAVELALLGRVPCRVTGDIDRGDLLTSSDRPGVATALAAQDYRPGSVIGKALEGHRGTGESTIEVMVGRL